MRFLPGLAASLLFGSAAAAPVSFGDLSTRQEGGAKVFPMVAVTFSGAPPINFYKREFLADGVPVKITGETLVISRISTTGTIKISCSAKSVATPDGATTPTVYSLPGGSSIVISPPAQFDEVTCNS